MAALLLAAFVLGAWLRQRFEPLTALPALLALAAFMASSEWWRERRLAAALLTVDVVLIFAYLWSLDERIHVTITVTPTAYSATTGSTTALVPNPTTHGNRIALFSGGLETYRTQATGEGGPRSATTPLARFGSFLRFAAPRPAWANVRMIAGNQQTNLLAGRVFTLSGQWSRNARGEMEGLPGSNLQIGLATAPSYTIEADLLRGDGTQGIVVGLDAHNQGALLTLRLDQPDMVWFSYNSGVLMGNLSGGVLHVGLVPMTQRVLRLLSGNIIAALVLLVLVLPFYFLVRGLLDLLGSDETDEVARVEGWLRPRVVDGAALAVAIAAVAAALVVASKLEHIPHVQDSVSNLWQAKILALGRIWAPVPDAALQPFFAEEFVVMHGGHWFSIYLPGWPVLLAVGVLLHIPWLVNPLLAGVNVLLIYGIGRTLYDRRIALLGALLAAASPFFIALAGEFMAHTATLLYLDGFGLGALLWIRCLSSPTYQPRERLYAAVAGFSIGMALITRPIDALTWGIPFAIFVALQPIRLARFQTGLWAVPAGLLPLVFLLLYDWSATGNPLKTPYALGPPFNIYGFSPHAGIFGHTLANGLWNTSFNLDQLLTDLFGWPFYLTLALAAVPFLTGRATRSDALMAATALTVIAAYVGYWGSGVMYGPRYYYAAVPPLALLTARGFEEIYRLPLRLLRGTPDRLAAIFIPTLLFAVLLAYDLTVSWPSHLDLYPGYNFTSAAPLNAVQRAHLHHAIVFTVDDPPGAWWSYGAVFPANSPLLNGDVIYVRDLGAQNAAVAQSFPGWATYRLHGADITRIHP